MSGNPLHIQDLDGTLLRLGLVGMAVATWQGASQVFESGNYAASNLTLTLQVVSYVAGLGLLVVATRAELPRWTVWLTLAAALLTFADYAAVHRANQVISGTPLTTDVHLFTDYAAYLIRSGVNPYEADLIESYRAHRAPMNFSTPLVSGDLTGRLAYPALHPLTYVPFQILGIPTFWVYPLLLVVGWLGIFVAVEPRYRPVVLLPFVIDHRYMLYALGGVSDFGWAALVVWMIVAWRHPTARAVLYGLAASYKHHPWLLAPFLLVRIYAEAEGSPRERLREVAHFALTSVATFAIVNLPFVIWNPVAWFEGVTEPAAAAMITWGQGLSTLTATGALVIPKPVHGLAMYGTLLLWLAFYATHGKRFRELLWLAPGLALFLGHRSLTSYWYFTVPPLMAALFSPAMRARPWTLTLPGEGAVRATLATAAIAGALLLAALPFRAPAVEIEVLRIDVEGDSARGMLVALTNTRDVPLEPAFQVQAWAMQPLFWDVISGPRRLEPGEEGLYYIESTVPFERFSTRAGAQLIVTQRDAYAPRVATRVEGDTSTGNPDVVPNGRWRFWTPAGVPAFWGLIRSPTDLDSQIDLLVRDNHRALSMWIPPHEGTAEVLLDTYILMPTRPIEISVFVPEVANHMPHPAVEYGLQLWAGGDPLRVLFGPEPSTGVLDSGVQYVTVPAPRGQWHALELDIKALLDQAGLVRPTQRTDFPRFHHLDFPMLPTHVQLLLIGHQGAEIEAYFGAIHQAHAPDVDALYDEAIRHPEIGLVWRGEYNIAVGNLSEGLQLLQEAASIAPDNGHVQFRLAEALLRLGRPGPALEAYARARDAGHLPAAAEIGVGWAAFSLEHLDDAREAFERSLHTPPDIRGDRTVRAEARKGLAYVAAAEGDCEASALEWSLASAMDPTLASTSRAPACVDPEGPQDAADAEADADGELVATP